MKFHGCIYTIYTSYSYVHILFYDKNVQYTVDVIDWKYTLFNQKQAGSWGMFLKYETEPQISFFAG